MNQALSKEVKDWILRNKHCELHKKAIRDHLPWELIECYESKFKTGKGSN